MSPIDAAYADAAGHKHAMIILGPEGHRMLTWKDETEVEDPAESTASIEAAMAEFARQKKLGRVAFEMDATGQIGTGKGKMDTFNPQAERIQFVAAIQGG